AGAGGLGGNQGAGAHAWRRQDAARRHSADAARAAPRVSDRPARGVGRVRLDAGRGRDRENTGRSGRAARGRERCAARSGARRRRNGRPPVREREPLAQARDRARNGAAEGQREVYEAVRDDGARDCRIRAHDARPEARRAGAGVATSKVETTSGLAPPVCDETTEKDTRATKTRRHEEDTKKRRTRYGPVRARDGP